MLQTMTAVPTDCLDNLAAAVERLRWLEAQSGASAEGGDPMSLFDALGDIYAASQRLVSLGRTATR
jgi:hypothetical protein